MPKTGTERISKMPTLILISVILFVELIITLEKVTFSPSGLQQKLQKVIGRKVKASTPILAEGN